MPKRSYSLATDSDSYDEPTRKKTYAFQDPTPSPMDVDSSPKSGFYIQHSPNAKAAPKCKLPTYYPDIFGCRKTYCYKFMAKLGEGAYGVVFKAKDKISGEKYALKKVSLEKDVSINTLREVYLLKNCHKKCENVINLREVVAGSTADKIYLAMDYMEWDMARFMKALNLKKMVNIPMCHVKNLMFQLLTGVNFLHHEFIIHRDLKPSNILLSKNGVLKIADFGLARNYGIPARPYTPEVVTLWYRPPELLLGSKIYSTPLDIWSVGCIFAEFMALDVLFPGTSEPDQVKKIFMTLGTPTLEAWPDFQMLPYVEFLNFPNFVGDKLMTKIGLKMECFTNFGYEFLKEFLMYNPEKRISAEKALKDIWFCGDPWPSSNERFSKWIKEVCK